MSTRLTSDGLEEDVRPPFPQQRRHSAKDKGSEPEHDLIPMNSIPAHLDSDSDEYIPSPEKSWPRKMKGKERASQSGEKDYDLIPMNSIPTYLDSDSVEYSTSPENPRPKKKLKGKGQENKPGAKDHDPPSRHPVAGGKEDITHRPNSFYGPPSTWLSWTQSERETIKALDQRRAEDLSAQLFVAYRIKAHGRMLQRQLSEVREASSKRESGGDADCKGQVESSEEKELDAGSREKPFLPPKIWTAWPMPPDQVPREFHTSGILDDCDSFTFQSPRDKRPSAELEEWIIASATRTARERWIARAWDKGAGCSSDYEEKKRWTGKQGRQEDLQELPHVSHMARDAQSPPQLFSSLPIQLDNRESPSALPHANSKSLSTYHTDHSGKLPQSPPPFDFLPPRASLCPVPLADDDRAREMLLPSSRHIIAKVDELLLALHRTRAAYSGTTTCGGDGNETQIEPETEKSTSRSRGRRANRGARSKFGSKTKSNAGTKGSPAEKDRKKMRLDGEESLSSPPRASSGRLHQQLKRRSKLDRLGLRDWSDVLGTAALTGWDGEVVQRAARRCAALFGDDMEFRTYHPPSSGGVGSESVQGNKVWLASGRVAPADIEGDEESDTKSQLQDEDDDPNNEGDTSITDAETDTDASTETEPPQFPPPHSAVHQPQTTSPATCTSNNYSSTPTAALSSNHHSLDPKREGRDHEHEQDEHGAGDGDDAIFCPVLTCNRHRNRPFLRANLLYRLVRRVHPGLDVGAVKERQKMRRKRSRSEGGEWK